MKSEGPSPALHGEKLTGTLGVVDEESRNTPLHRTHALCRPTAAPSPALGAYTGPARKSILFRRTAIPNPSPGSVRTTGN